jgi:hypothetical protein
MSDTAVDWLRTNRRAARAALSSLAAIGVLLVLAADAAGQLPPLPRAPGPADVRMRMGPVVLNPTISLANFGMDDNVFYDPEAEDPKSDFTVTLTPQSDWWLRMGRTWLAGYVREDVVWYREYDSESSVNGRYGLGYVAPLTRVTFAGGGNWINARERPGFEIDTRPQRTETIWNGLVEVRALSRTHVGVRLQYREVIFADEEVFLGRNLREELNRTETLGSVALRHELTPLTSVSFEVARSIDDFQFRPDRSTQSTRLRARLDFDPVALISGTAQVGYRNFRPDSSEVPEFRGLTAAVGLTYVVLGSTRMTLAANRDVEYSFNSNRPYYLLTGVSGTVAQRIYGPVDVEGRAGRQVLDYRERFGAVLDAPDRTDYVRTLGAGIGYRFGDDLRLGVNLDQQRRTSSAVLRRYESLRLGLSMTYGI